MAKNIKREVIEWAAFFLIGGGLYFTGYHTEVIGTLQRIVLSTGIFQPSENEANVLADYDLVLEDLEGNTLDLADWKGKPIFLNFWATWCPPCIAEMPDINKLYQSVNKEVHFAIISVDEDREKAKAFAKRKDFDFPIYFPKSRLPKVYESTTIPTTYVINTKGTLSSVKEAWLNTQVMPSSPTSGGFKSIKAYI